MRVQNSEIAEEIGVELVNIESENLESAPTPKVSVTIIDAFGKRVEESISQNQKKFAEYYISNPETMGNGTRSYLLAYGLDGTKKSQYDYARASSSKLLKSLTYGRKVQGYILQLVSETCLNQANILANLGFLVNQNADLATKHAAIKTSLTMLGLLDKHKTVTHRNADNRTKIKAIKIKSIPARETDISDD